MGEGVYQAIRFSLCDWGKIVVIIGRKKGS
jgi:hypothetical protein